MRIRRDRLTWREVDGDVVALDLETSTYFSANSTASVLLRQLADGAEEATLVEAVLAEFDVAPEQAEADVAAFLTSLRSMGIVEE